MPDWLSGVVPDWLAEVMRPKKVPPPWGTMLRAVLAIWVPLAVGFISGHRVVGLLPAMGGLMSIMIDNGGPFRARVRRVGTAAVFGGALGLTIGSLIHGRGWVAVVCIVAVAGVSSLLARLGGTGSVTGLQLMIYSAISLGPFGALRPWWHTALEFVIGVAWALLLLVPGWLRSPRGVEQRLVAAVYHRIADDLRAIGTPGTVAAHQNVTAALNAAYDALLTGRSAASGRSTRGSHLMAILNVSHQMAEAAGALRHEGERPPQWVTATVDRLADAVTDSPPRFITVGLGRVVPPGGSVPALPTIPPQWSDSPGALALRESMVTLARVVSGNWTPPGPADTLRPGLLARVRARAHMLREQFLGGWIAWSFTIRLMLCTGVAAVISEVTPLARSYWVVLTVAIILKPDYGSVFARALQRGIGTVLGAVLGAAIVAVVPYGPWLLVPSGVLAALLPYGKARNFGLSAVFLTPFVVLLIDLLNDTGWRLAGDRALDTIVATAIVLLVGYAPWPVSWQAHLPGQFAGTLRVICSYLTESLVTSWENGKPLPRTDQGGVTQARSPGQPAPTDLVSPTNQPRPTSQPGSPGQPAPADPVSPAVFPRPSGPDRPPVQPRPTSQPASPGRRSGLRRQAFRSLSDLRAEFQRTMSEPQRVSRRAAAWWPALVGLEELLDAITATSLAIGRGAPRPAPKSVYQIAGTLRAVADSIEAGITPKGGPLPADPELQPVTDAVRSVLAVLSPGGQEPASETDATIRSV